MIDDYNNSDKSIEDISAMLIEFINIHPYGDGNGRTQRLLLKWALLSIGHEPIYINVEDRAEYVEFMEDEDVQGFTYYIYEKLILKYKEYTNLF